VATAVANRLASLASQHQVIVITHLAQIAAIAQSHLLVEKQLEGNTATTVIRPISGEERVAEIARMLSGSSDDLALQHARQLLEQGQV